MQDIVDEIVMALQYLPHFQANEEYIQAAM